MIKNKLIAATLLSFTACASDTDDKMMDDPMPTAFKLRIDNIAPWTVLKSGVQATKTNGTTGALAMGQAYEISFTAGRNQRVSFASMLGESNDWFFAPGPDGIALYDAQGNPVSGDVTGYVKLWDAGTEIDQEPAVGDAVGPRQPAPDFGAADPNPTVRELYGQVTLTDGSKFTLPSIASMIRVTLTPGANRTFTLRIENVSTTSTLVTSVGGRDIHVSPPVWALHIAPAPLFTPGEADRAQGLELVAESGRFPTLQGSMRALAGWPTPISPGVYAVHDAPEPLYALGLVDRNQGLERLAEDGNNGVLADAMMGIAAGGMVADAGAFEVPADLDMRAPARPGQAYELTVAGLPGEYLSFATMFGMSDDWFFATVPEGIALFDAWGMPMTGDVTDRIALYDAGTEVDQEPAIGPDTGPQQPAPNTGAADPVRNVREVPQAIYGVPASGHLKITLLPQ
ncbi:MAG TPA: spondin domain-containing protein [Kofleriaceae bacterium]